MSLTYWHYNLLTANRFRDIRMGSATAERAFDRLSPILPILFRWSGVNKRMGAGYRQIYGSSSFFEKEGAICLSAGIACRPAEQDSFFLSSLPRGKEK
jgi:hypothetical protein